MITWRNDMKCKRTVLPLLGTAFEPGRLADTLNEFEDEELAEIAQAEAYFFSTGRSLCENCRKISEQRGCDPSYASRYALYICKSDAG